MKRGIRGQVERVKYYTGFSEVRDCDITRTRFILPLTHILLTIHTLSRCRAPAWDVCLSIVRLPDEQIWKRVTAIDVCVVIQVRYFVSPRRR
jgi:hypothetical protein